MNRFFCKFLTLLMLLPACTMAAESTDPRDYTPLKELSARHGFLMGAALSYGNMGDAKYTAPLMHHFDTFTATN